MATKSTVTYCNIGKYIAQTDRELYDLMDECCATQLIEGSSKFGLTFLHPTSPEWRKKFKHAVETDKGAAEDMIRTLVLRDTFKTGRDWATKRDNIPNSLFPFQHVAIKSSNDREVMFESGAKAVLDSKFVDDSRKKNLAVWTLVSGEIPVTKDKPAKIPAGKPGHKTGTYEPEKALSESLRFQIGLIVENEYAREELNRRKMGSRFGSATYLKYTLSLVRYLLSTGNEHMVHDCVLPNISFDHMDFYILVEPHSASGPYLIDDHTIQGWWSDTGSRHLDIMSEKNKVMEMQSSGHASHSAAVYGHRSQLHEAIHRERMKILQGRSVESAQNIVNLYRHLETSNSLGGVSSVFPAGLASHFASHPGLKLTQDELRYLIHMQFCELEAGHTFDLAKFNYIVNYIGDRLHASAEDSRVKLRTLINPSNLRYHIRPKEHITEIGLFVNSTMFAFVPCTAEETRAVCGKEIVTRPTPGSKRFYNIQQAIHSAQLRILPELSAEFHNEVVSMIRTLDPASLTAESREELRRLLA